MSHFPKLGDKRGLNSRGNDDQYKMLFSTKGYPLFVLHRKIYLFMFITKVNIRYNNGSVLLVVSLALQPINTNLPHYIYDVYLLLMNSVSLQCQIQFVVVR